MPPSICALTPGMLRVAWAMLRESAVRVPGTIISEGDLAVTFPNGSRIRLFGADLPDALRGIRLDGVVLDEVTA